jgi:hypothetical protein
LFELRFGGSRAPSLAQPDSRPFRDTGDETELYSTNSVGMKTWRISRGIIRVIALPICTMAQFCCAGENVDPLRGGRSFGKAENKQTTKVL